MGNFGKFAAKIKTNYWWDFESCLNNLDFPPVTNDVSDRRYGPLPQIYFFSLGSARWITRFAVAGGGVAAGISIFCGASRFRNLPFGINCSKTFLPHK